jgi:integrase
LPEEKLLMADALEEWERHLRETALVERTVQNRVYTVKRFLKYLEDPDSFSVQNKKKEAEPTPEKMTNREEYHLLLQAAREMGYRRTYLLIKTMVCLGIRSTEIENLSVEGLKKGADWIPFRNSTRSITVFEPLRTELLEYAAERGIQEGAVFAKKDGLPMEHFLIWKEIKKVCRRIGLPEEKGIPKSLYQLYIQTRIDLAKRSAVDAEKNSRALLEQEEALIGWN